MGMDAPCRFCKHKAIESATGESNRMLILLMLTDWHVVRVIPQIKEHNDGRFGLAILSMPIFGAM